MFVMSTLQCVISSYFHLKVNERKANGMCTSYYVGRVGDGMT